MSKFRHFYTYYNSPVGGLNSWVPTLLHCTVINMLSNWLKMVVMLIILCDIIILGHHFTCRSPASEPSMYEWLWMCPSNLTDEMGILIVIWLLCTSVCIQENTSLSAGQGSQYYVYCKTVCHSVCPGRLRVRCAKCKQGSLEVERVKTLYCVTIFLSKASFSGSKG